MINNILTLINTSSISIFFNCNIYCGFYSFWINNLLNISGYGDIRKIGSGNIGATNVLRTGNKILAFLTLILDVLKSFLLLLIVNTHFQQF